MPGPNPIHADSPISFTSRSGKRIQDSVLYTESLARVDLLSPASRFPQQYTPIQAVILLETIPAATGTAEAYEPIPGEAPVYYLDESSNYYTYTLENTTYFEWWGGEVTVSEGMGRLGFVIGTMLIPLCVQVNSNPFA